MSIITDFAQTIIDKQVPEHKIGSKLNEEELRKAPSRTEIINYLVSLTDGKNYLEIGVRNPNDNFNHIIVENKYSVDPGVEFEENPVDFKLTSDAFFEKKHKGEILENVLFDVIFIDGLHLAEQVERDIDNSINNLAKGGFVVMHDCNPPSEWHARETYDYKRTPAGGCWNGTTWKAFANARKRTDIFSCCIDTDWGVGVLSKDRKLGTINSVENPYWEYKVLEQNRKEILNLMNFDEFKSLIA